MYTECTILYEIATIIIMIITDIDNNFTFNYYYKLFVKKNVSFIFLKIVNNCHTVLIPLMKMM